MMTGTVTDQASLCKSRSTCRGKGWSRSLVEGRRKGKERKGERGKGKGKGAEMSNVTGNKCLMTTS